MEAIRRKPPLHGSQYKGWLTVKNTRLYIDIDDKNQPNDLFLPALGGPHSCCRFGADETMASHGPQETKPVFDGDASSCVFASNLFDFESQKKGGVR